MPCKRPRLALQNMQVKQPLRFVNHGKRPFRDADGRDPLVFLSSIYAAENSPWKPIKVPCGGCLWCRLQLTRDKAVRCMHEASLYEDNCFLTLTYSPEHLPSHGSFEHEHVQTFMKDLRIRHPGRTIRSFGCAEYGAKFARPHFHLLIFNYGFPDKTFWRYSKNDWSKDKWPVHRSKELETLWPYGFSEIGSLTVKSASYVARYVTKKITGKAKSAHYGEHLPERSVAVSLRPGIGLPWLKLFHSEVLQSDRVVFNGREVSMPRYYANKLEEWFPDRFALVKEKRLREAKEINLDGTKERVETIELCRELGFKIMKRGFEDGEA